MKAQEFLQLAEITVSPAPTLRIPPAAQGVLERNNFIVDAHAHFFDGACVDERYFITRIIASVPESIKSRIWRVLTGQTLDHQKSICNREELTEEVYTGEPVPRMANFGQYCRFIDAQLDVLENEADQATEKVSDRLELKGFIKRLRTIISILRKNSMSNVASEFFKKYAINKVYNTLYDDQKEVIAIGLGMDLNQGWNQRIEKTFMQQANELAALGNTYPVLPFLPLDPRRKDLFELFLEAFSGDQPAYFGVKCYPALGYLPSDSRLDPIFRICAEKQIPVMTHCGGNIISTFDNPVELNRKGIMEWLDISPRAARARFLNEPREWIPVLIEHPELRLCLGHFGSTSVWENVFNEPQPRIETILFMMQQYPHVYADFSFNIESESATDNLFRVLNEDSERGRLFRERTMFGTDYWVILPTSNLQTDQQYFLQQSEGLKDALLKNNFIRYIGIDALA